MFDNIVLELAVIFFGSAVLSTVFLFLKQPIIIAYIILGVLIGPWGFKLVTNAQNIESMSHLGIILLLFLIGLELEPKKLLHLFKKTFLVAFITSFIFNVLVVAVLMLFQFNFINSLIAGLALMFSSTVISIKLIPTTDLHQKRKGELTISVLLFQDIFAILVLLFLMGQTSGNIYITVLLLIAKMLAVAVFAFVAVKFVLLALIKKFDVILEYIFLLAIGWCLALAEGAKLIGLSYEMGAFIAGVSLAISPIALYIVENLKPIKNFFLILFFFSIGAKFDFLVTQNVLLPAIIVAVLLLIVKPISFIFSFKRIGEKKEVAKELGFRLGQASEFSILVAFTADRLKYIHSKTSVLIQLATIITFVISTYLVIYYFPTPISPKKEMRKN